MAASDWEDLELLFEQAAAASPEERDRMLNAQPPQLAARLRQLLDSEHKATRHFDALADRVQSSAQRDPVIGTAIGPFHVKGILGRGGMGIVYRAEDPRLERLTAIKVLPHLHREDSETRSRFLREARTASSLSHPNVCTIYQVGEDAGVGPYMAMQCYEGSPLEADRSMPPEQAAALVAQVAAGLQAAHSQGVVHRDVKPSNVFVTTEGRAVLLDFGIAQVRQTRTQDGRLTPGTLAYMSPEQLEGGVVDGRTDVWSAGVLLYQLLTGRLPFAADSAGETRRAILAAEPPPLPKTVPRRLRKVVRMCLEREPSARPDSAGALQAMLTPVSRERVRFRRLAAVSGIVVVALAWLLVARQIGELGPPSILVTPFTDATPGGGNQALAWGIGNELGLLLRPLGSVEVRRSQQQVTDVASARDDFGVDYVLTGSIQSENGRLHITPELIDARTAQLVFSFQMVRRPESPLVVQRAVALAVLDTLNLQVVGKERRRLERLGTTNLQAAEALQRARFLMARRTPQAFLAAIPSLEEAIAADSGYADAWAELAQATALLGGAGYTPARGGETFARAEGFLERALALDPESSVAYMTRGYIEHEWHWNWLRSELAFRRALDLDPGSPTAHHLYATHLAEIGETDRALNHIERAGTLDPEASIIAANHGLILFFARRYRSSTRRLNALVARDDSFYVGFVNRALPSMMLGRHEQAEQDLKRAADLVAASSLIESLRAVNSALQYRPGGVETAAELERSGAAPSLIATIYLAAGDTTRGLQWLERGLAEHDVYMTLIDVWPLLDPVRDSPRFQAIRSEMSLP